MDLKRIDLTGRNGVTLKVDLEKVDPNKRYYVTIKDPKKGTILYERMASSKDIYINLPVHPQSIDLGIIGSPKIDTYMLSSLERVSIPLELAPEVRRPFEIKDIKRGYNYQMQSPARFYTKKPLIEENPRKMALYNHAVQVFIRYHEMAHYWYDTEWKADLWAMVAFLNDGFNMSSAEWALTHVLSRSPDNTDRIKKARPVLNFINSTYYS